MIEFKEQPDGLDRYSAKKADPVVPGRQAATYNLCSESDSAYQQLRKVVFDHFHPQTPFACLTADALVDLLWREDRYRIISSDLCDLRIARDYEENSANYPNADARLHTTLAFSSLVGETPYPAAENRLLQLSKAAQHYTKTLEKLCKKS